MAVSLSLGFTDEYSAGFQKLTAEIEAQEQATNKLKKATDEHNEALRRMAREHADATRAMLTGREASGSLTTQLSKQAAELARTSKSGEDAKKSTDLLSGSMTTLALRAGKVGLVLKGIQLAYKGITSDSLINEHIKNVTKDLITETFHWKNAEKEIRAAAKRTRDARDAMLGISPASREVTEALAKQAEGWKRLNAIRGDNEKAKAAENELRELSKLNTELAVKEALWAQQQITTKVMTDSKATLEEKERATQKLIALENRLEEVIAGNRQKREEVNRQAIERETEMRRQAADREIEMQRQAFEEEKRLREEARRIAEAHADGEREMLMDMHREIEDRWRQRVQGQKNAHEIMRREETKTAEFRAKLALETAKSEEEAVRIQNALRAELRAIDFRAEQAAEQQKVELAKKAAQEKIDAERKRIDAIKGMTDAHGKNLFESLVGAQAGRKDDKGQSVLFEEVVRRRLAAEKQQRGEMGPEQQRRLERFVRRMTQRGLTTQGDRTDQAEIVNVQRDMAASVALQAAKSGKVTTENIKALQEQARVNRDQAQVNEEQARAIQEIQQQMKTEQQIRKEQVQRLHSQRRGLRG